MGPILRRFMAVVSLGAVIALAGCGAGTNPVTGGGVAAASNLSGNWLIAGSLPNLPGPLSGSSTSFGIAATFDVVANHVTGILSTQFVCSSLASGLPAAIGGVVSGSVAADGSFTLSTPTAQSVNLPLAVTLNGHVPTTSGGAWTGTYTVASSGYSCPGSLSGNIAANSFPLVAGSYSGISTVTLANTALVEQVGVKATLQQGGATTLAGLSTNLLMTGTLAVQGSNCLTSGVTGALSQGSSVPGVVEGNTVLANFTMNDGSNVEMLGSVTAMDSSKLSVSFITTASGSCGLNFFTLQPSVLTK